MAPRSTTKRPRSAAQLANDAKFGAQAKARAGAAPSLIEEAQPDPLASLMADPVVAARLADLVNAAVAARMAQPASAASPAPTAEFGDLVKALEKTLIAQAEQMPGYFKPLPAEEVARRARGKVEMFAMLESFKAAGTPPRYYVGANKFYAGCVQYEEGFPINTYLPPPEDFEPCYEPDRERGETYAQGREAGQRAERVLDAQLQWLGGHSPDIATRVSEAEAEHHARTIPLVGDEVAAAASRPVEIVAGITPRGADAKPAFAAMGETVVPGMGGVPIPPQAPGSRNAPARGPAFVE